MTATRGVVVEISTMAVYEQLIAHPGSVSGWFDPTKAYGEVWFTTQAVAQRARREV